MNKRYKVLSINSSNFGSTGSIMMGISEVAESNNYETYIAYPSSKSNFHKKVDNSIVISNRVERNFHIKLAFETGMNGCYSKIGTKIFCKKISGINPDIIHLHNLHNCYINLETLFAYLKKQNIPVVWTLHDCWAFTGQCPHFTMVNCNKWKTGCYECPQYKKYPASRLDKTKEMYIRKKEWFTGVKNLIIVTPSEWLKMKVQQSFLSKYQVKAIQNGIDLSVFKPQNSGFRKKHRLEEKVVLLGVAHSWGQRKGLDIFIELSYKLDEKYQIVLVGLSKEQIKILPEKIVGIRRTRDNNELAEIYSAADYFINPSREETMGLVTAEALACGTPAIVSNSTAVPEIIDSKSGIIVAQDNSDSYLAAILTDVNKFKKEECIVRAKKFDKNIKYKQYLELYDSILHSKA